MRSRVPTLIAAAALLLTGCAKAEPTTAPEPDLLASVQDPLVIAHRGGALVYPEHSMEGYRAAADAGFAAEPDIQFLADGTPVAIHDPDVDRTMTGIAGPVSDLTLAEWTSGRIKPAPVGGATATPVTFAEVLDKIGGDTLLVPEVKPGATPEEVDTVIDMIEERDLGRDVLTQSGDYAAVQQMLDAGLECLYLTGRDLPPESPEQLNTDGVDWVGADRRMTPADVELLTDAGIRVIAYTIQTQAELDALPDSYVGYFSDDPWSQTQP